MLRATLLALVSALFSVGTWIVSPAEAGEPGDPPTATPARSAGPVESAAEEERPPEPISAPEAPVLEEPQPARDPGAPDQPAAVPPEEELIVEPESTEGPEPEPPVVEAPDKPEPDFDYVEAQKNVEDQLSFLRNCMLKGDKPLTVLKFRADVQPRGRPIFHVFGSNREARACVREGMRRCMFDPSPRGGAFVYTVTNTTGKLRRVPVNPKYVKVPTP